MLGLVSGIKRVLRKPETSRSPNCRSVHTNFQRLFPFVLLLDVIWATSPFLLTHLIGVGLAFAACAALVYSPFAQRVLALMAYPPER